MKVSLLLAVVLIWALPPALALNCTLFSGEYHTLCTVVNPLPIDDDYKDNLMRPNLYGTIETNTEPINLEVIDTTSARTMEDIYNEKISFVGKLALFILVNYLFFKFLTKSERVRKWLTADY